MASLLQAVKLPTKLAGSVPVDGLLDAMRFDKKAQAGVIRLILPTAKAAVVLDDIPQSVVRAAWASVMPMFD